MLSLTEEFLLLSLEDEKGTFDFYGSYGVAGAALIELMMQRRLAVEDGKLQVRDGTPTGDAASDFILRTIADSKKLRSPAHWVFCVASKTREVRAPLVKRLVDLGILEERKGKVLWLFRVTRYPECDGQSEDALVEELREVILSGKSPDVRSAALIALADASGVISRILSKEERKSAKQRIEEISSDQVIPQAVAEAIRTVQAAAVTSTIAGL